MSYYFNRAVVMKISIDSGTIVVSYTEGMTFEILIKYFFGSFVLISYRMNKVLCIQEGR